MCSSRTETKNHIKLIRLNSKKKKKKKDAGKVFQDTNLDRERAPTPPIPVHLLGVWGMNDVNCNYVCVRLR